MTLPILAGVAALLALAPQDVDTTFAVPAGARIEVENFRGDVAVRTWNRNAVRVVATHSGQDRVSIRTTGSVVRIASESRRGVSRDAEYLVTIPNTSALRVTGPFNDVTVDGAGGDVTVENVRGDIRVRGGNGVISLRSVEGEVTLEDSRGRVSLGAVNDDIRLSNVIGEILAEGVNGDVIFDRVQSGDVRASTVNGDIEYDGTIRDAGRYAFTTHNGDVVLQVPASANATFTISTFNGEIVSDLPVVLAGARSGRQFSFAVGNGSARIDLESFNGTIHLRRPASATSQENQP